MYAPAPGAAWGSVSLTVVRSPDQTAGVLERAHYVVCAAREPGRNSGTSTPTTNPCPPAYTFWTICPTGATFPGRSLESTYTGGGSRTHVYFTWWLVSLEHFIAWANCLATTTTFPGNSEPLDNSIHELHGKWHHSNSRGYWSIDLLRATEYYCSGDARTTPIAGDPCLPGLATAP